MIFYLSYLTAVHLISWKCIVSEVTGFFSLVFCMCFSAGEKCKASQDCLITVSKYKCNFPFSPWSIICRPLLPDILPWKEKE